MRDPQTLNVSPVSFKANTSRLSVEEILAMIAELGDLYESVILPRNNSYLIDQLLLQLSHGEDNISGVMKRVSSVKR